MLFRRTQAGASFALLAWSLAALCGAGCDDARAPAPDPVVVPGPGTELIRETMQGVASASVTASCSETFRISVDSSYFQGGTGRCAEFARHSVTPGVIKARLTWQDPRIDLDLVLNNGAGLNFRQSIAANRCCETIEFFVNGGTDYRFVVYLRGVDPQFLANGGAFTGDVATAFTLEVERPR